MSKKYLVLVALLLLCLPSRAVDKYTKREVRGVWMATVYCIDWPTTTGTTIAIRNSQKNEMLGYLDLLQKNNFNSVYFQVRSMCDAMYKSSYEPWSSYLTGKRGQSVSWDPLAFVVEECHKRGLECHAWVNPYRWCASAAGWDTKQDRELKEKNMLISYDNGSAVTTILNPALKETNERIVNVCKELIEKYDIDGIIFDDYFYPSGMPTTSSADDYKDYINSGTKMSFGDWRRRNVNNMVANVYRMIQETDPSIRFGISPAGAASTDASVAAKHHVEKMPVASDWQYNGIFSDPVAWLEEGTIDYISPQIYWKTDHSTNPFGPMTQWWSKIAKQFKRHHYASHSLTFLQSSGNTENDWKEVGKQLQYSRSYSRNAAPGEIYYSACDIDGKKVKGLGKWLLDNKYMKPSLPPAITWKEAEERGKVENLIIDGNTLKWEQVENMRYSIYAIPEEEESSELGLSSTGGLKSDYLLGMCYSTSYTIPKDYRTGYYFAICILDRYGNEYEPRFSNEGVRVNDLMAEETDIVLKVQLYNSSGQLMQSADSEEELNTSSLPRGVYVVRIQKKKSVDTRKVLVR